MAVGLGAALWGLVPIVFLAARAGRRCTVFTGADGLFSADQLQYLAWIRDASQHGLVSNLFDVVPSAPVSTSKGTWMTPLGSAR